MKKNKINALLAAGCMALVAPGMANAAIETWDDLTDVTADKTKSVGEDNTAVFTQINTSSNATLKIDSTNGTVSPATGDNNGVVTMSGTSKIEFAPAIMAITFNKTEINGTNNTITANSNSTGAVKLGDTTITSGHALTLVNKGKGTINAQSMNVNGTLNIGSADNLNTGDVTNDTIITDGGVINVNGGKYTATTALIRLPQSGTQTFGIKANNNATATLDTLGFVIPPQQVLGKVNYDFNAIDAGSTINVNTGTSATPNISLYTDESLKMTGDGKVNIGGTVIANGGKITATNTNENSVIENLRINACNNPIPEYREGPEVYSLNTVNNKVDTIRVNTLTLDNQISPDTVPHTEGRDNYHQPKWVLDIDYNNGNVKTDTIVVNEAITQSTSEVPDTTLDFVIDNVSNKDNITGNSFVKYIKLVDTSAIDNVNVLSDTIRYDSFNNEYVKTINDLTLNNSNNAHLYYSYDSEPTEGSGSYAANTIRVTDFKITENKLLDAVTLQGIREYTVDFDKSGKREDTVYYVSNGYNIVMPNMQARQDVDNILTLNSNGYFTGFNKKQTLPDGRVVGENMQSQMFILDTTDPDTEYADRTLNLNGITFTHALSDPDYAPKNDETTYAFKGNTQQGMGSVIYLNSDSKDVVAGKATVNLGSYYGEDSKLTTYTAFTENYSSKAGGAVYSKGANSNIYAAQDVPVNFTNNRSGGNGGAIHNTTGSKIELLGSNTFSDNIAGIKRIYDYKNPKVYNWSQSVGDGGAIYNTNNGIVTIGSENADGTHTTNTFLHNEAFGNGGAIAAVNNETNLYGDMVFKNNIAVGNTIKDVYTPGNGGAIAATQGATVNMVGSQAFRNNASTGKGGAIYATDPGTVVNITANRDTIFEGNRQGVTFKNAEEGSSEIRNFSDINATTGETINLPASCGHMVQNGSVVGRTNDPNHVYDYIGESNAIFIENNATVNLATTPEARITFKDKIASDDAPETTLHQLPGSQVHYENDMSGFKGNFIADRDAEAYFTTWNAVPFQDGTYTFGPNSGIYMLNHRIIPVHAKSVDLSGTTIFEPLKMSLDLNLTHKVADCFLTDEPSFGTVLVTDINATGVGKGESQFYPILNGANFISAVTEIDDSYYKYNVQGVNSGLMLTRGDLADSSLLGPQVAVNARLAGQLSIYDSLLHRVDEIAENRYFYKAQKTNLYAADPDVKDDRHIDNGYTPYVNQQDGGNLWAKPTFTLEHVTPEGLHGYENRAYNTFLGYEMPVATMKNNWDLISTIFGGYQGSYQDWDHASNWQNGGSFGYMANLYHNNFFTGGVVMMGGTAVNVNDGGSFNRGLDFGLFDVGGGIRAGYNVGLGKHWLLQPMLTASYIYISGIDQHNSAGESIDMSGTHTFQIAPGFKLIGNYGGWKPYLLCDYTWPIVAKTSATINDVDMPDLRLKSYIEYGVGIRKDFGERFTGHVEAVMRNGGRTGASFQGGLVFKF